MKILVTGGMGFIGHHVVEMLEQHGHDVVIIDNETTYGIIDRRELHRLMEERSRQIQTTRIYGHDIQDATNVEWVYARYEPDLVIHLASFPRQKVVNANPAVGSRTMSEGLLNLLELNRKYRVEKFVYISSSMVYGDFPNGTTEDRACDPQGQYGVLKLAGEWLTRDYARRTGMNYTILRPSAVYGPVDVEDRVISKFLLTAMRGGEIQVNGANESLDFTYVTDTARGIVLAALSDAANGKTYNITRGVSRSLLEAAELAVRIAGSGTIAVRDPSADFPSRGQLDISRAREDFGFSPAIDIEQGFQQYYEWLANSLYRDKKAV